MAWKARATAKHRSDRNGRILLFAGIAAALVCSGFIFLAHHFPTNPSPQPSETVLAPPPEEEKILSGRIAKRDTLSSSLRSLGLRAEVVETICRQVRGLFDPRRINPGDTFQVRLTPEGKFREFSYQASPIRVFQLVFTPTGEWVRKRKEIPVEKYWIRIEGEITSSLFDSIESMGEQDDLVLAFADIFAWDIDFHSEPQPGDRFRMLVEKYYVGETLVQYGRILFAEYQTSSRIHQAVFFEPSPGRGGYYTPDGKPLHKKFLRSPLKFTRISSGFSKSRLHPILRRYRPHLGIDYAAPSGTPVWAIAEGRVVFSGWRSGYGKQVVLEHTGGYRTMYSHLRRIPPGVRRGTTILQKEVIGYVGSTGLSTGPHLDFRLLKSGVFRDPLREISTPGEPLGAIEFSNFREYSDSILYWVQDPDQPRWKKVAFLTSNDPVFQ